MNLAHTGPSFGLHPIEELDLPQGVESCTPVNASAYPWLSPVLNMADTPLKKSLCVL